MKPRLRKTVSCRTGTILGSALALAACSAPDDLEDGVDLLQEEVVGGSLESGYPSAGYLTRGTLGGTPTSLVCSAVQVGPNLVLTGAHCFVNWGDPSLPFTTSTRSWGFGRGGTSAGEIYRANRITIHSLYDPSDTNRYEHDLALVHFDEAIGGGKWAEVVTASTGTQCGTASASEWHTYVGYGRDTPGPSGTPGTVGLRKSATQCVSALAGVALEVTGVDGGLCWGDSGGPLYETGTERVSGVLSDFDGVFNCQVANDMLFTRLSVYAGLICGGTEYVGNGELCGRSFAAEQIIVL